MLNATSSPTKKFRELWAFLAAALVLAALGWPAPCLHGQDDDAKRDAWQRPTEVLDALGVKPGSAVADVGAGEGYFTFHLAARVGPQGKVYAEDISDEGLAKIRSRIKKHGLSQIETILGAPGDPHLPAASLDAILVVNAYHEMREFDAMAGGMYRALKPAGLLAIIDATDEPGKSRSTYQESHTLPAEIVREDMNRNGFRFLRELRGFANLESKRKYYFLLFEKHGGTATFGCALLPFSSSSQDSRLVISSPRASPPPVSLLPDSIPGATAKMAVPPPMRRGDGGLHADHISQTVFPAVGRSPERPTLLAP